MWIMQSAVLDYDFLLECALARINCLLWFFCVTKASTSPFREFASRVSSIFVHRSSWFIKELVSIMLAELVVFFLWINLP